MESRFLTLARLCLRSPNSRSSSNSPASTARGVTCQIFVVLVRDRLELVEVKHKRDVTRDVLDRTARLQAIAPDLGSAIGL